MASLAYNVNSFAPERKPPGIASLTDRPAQYNFLTQSFEVLPQQLELPLPVTDEVILPHYNTVPMLVTENGAQLFVSGFGLYVGKKGERLVIKHHGKACAQALFSAFRS